MSWGQFTPSFLPCNHSLTDVRFQHNWAPPACHRPFPTFYTFAIEGTGFLPQAGKLLGLTTTPVRRNGRRQLSPRESPHSRRLAATCPSRPHPLLADLPCLLGLLPHKRPQAMTFHPNPLLLGASVSPSPPPHPTGGAGAELSATACPPPGVTPAGTWSQPKRGRRWGVDTSGQVTSRGCAGTPATSGAGRVEGQGPGHPGPGEGPARSYLACRPPGGPWRLRVCYPTPEHPDWIGLHGRLTPAFWPDACLGRRRPLGPLPPWAPCLQPPGPLQP